MSGPPTVATAMVLPRKPEYLPRSRGLIIAAIAICTRACRPPRPSPGSTRNMIRPFGECAWPASMEPTMKTTIASCSRSFLLNRSANLPQIGVETVEASSVAATTQVYWLWVPCRSVMIVGRAFETTVEDRNATNIASIIPERASRIWRCVMRPCCSTGASAATVVLKCSPVSSGGRAGCFGSAEGAHGRRLEVGQEAVEQLAEPLGGLLVPAGEGGRGPVRALGAGRGEGGRTGRGEGEEAGAPVAGVGTARDVAGPLQGGDLPAHHRHVDAGPGGQGAAALLAVALQGHEQGPPERRQVAVDLRGRPGGDVPAGADQPRQDGRDPHTGVGGDRHRGSPQERCLLGATIRFCCPKQPHLGTVCSATDDDARTAGCGPGVVVVRSGLGLFLGLGLGLRLAGLAEPVEPPEQLAERRDVAGRPVGEVPLPAGAAGLADAGQPGSPPR